MAEYTAKNYDGLLGIEGLSDALLKNHFTLYQGYVTNTNKLAQRLSELASKGETSTPEYAELKRRFGWEFDGMRLHEYYFENLSKAARPCRDGSRLQDKLKQDFGGVEAWEKDFRGAAALRGIGWVILYYDRQGDRLFNAWVNEHDCGHLAGCAPILVMDVFEHAFMLDYGTKRPGYIDAFFKKVDWGTLERRFEDALTPARSK
jgi:Fe-Mn family superoxide dismutase